MSVWFQRALAGVAVAAFSAAGALAQTSTVEIFGTIDTAIGDNPFDIDAADGDSFLVEAMFTDSLATPNAVLTPNDDMDLSFILNVFPDGSPPATIAAATGQDFGFPFGPIFSFDGNGDLSDISFLSDSFEPSISFEAQDLSTAPTGSLVIDNFQSAEYEITGTVDSVSPSNGLM